jgi:hypothetical protein
MKLKFVGRPDVYGPVKRLIHQLPVVITPGAVDGFWL